METLYMPQAYVLINVESGAEDDVVKVLKKIDGVEEAYYSYGVYDIISKVKADSMENLKDMVTRNIRTLSSVRSTLTLIMMEE
jgi:DNA-binding Lrp family transcriptional regulator